MSTRCCIFVEKKNNQTEVYYHHHDGYLEGVGRALLDIPQNKRTNRKALEKGLGKMYGGKTELEFDKIVPTTQVSEMFKPMIEDATGARGGRYDNTNIDGHSDIEYRYRILLDGSLEVDSINLSLSWRLPDENAFLTLVQRFAEGDYED